MLFRSDESDVGLDEAGLAFVVLQAGAGIEGADVVDGLLHGVGGTADGFGNFFVRLVLHGAQVLVDDGNGIQQNLCGAIDGLVAILMERELLLVIAQLAEQAFAKIAATHTRRIKLANDFESFLEIGGGESGGINRAWRCGVRGRRWLGRGGGG